MPRCANSSSRSARRPACARLISRSGSTRRQDYISYVETGQKLVELLELMEWAEAVGFDAQDAIDATDSCIAESPAFRRREID
jgi:hypothetical protein